MNKRIIITGVNGFVGYHLSKQLKEKGYDTVGIALEDRSNEKVAPFLNTYYQANLVEKWPEVGKVDAIIHLAGLSAVGASFARPQLYINGNTAMITNLCEYYLDKEKPRLLVVSSGAIYESEQELPICERSALGVHSPYAVSKIAVENQVSYYNERGFEILIARPFNHIGQGQGRGFLLPDLYHQIQNLSRGEREVKVGNLKTARDYTDVRDVAAAYIQLIEKETLDGKVFNICSGVSHTGVEIFQLILEKLGRTDIRSVVSKSLIRPTEVRNIYGSFELLHKATGWTPQYSLKDSVASFIDFELKQKVGVDE